MPLVRFCLIALSLTIWVVCAEWEGENYYGLKLKPYLFVRCTKHFGEIISVNAVIIAAYQ